MRDDQTARLNDLSESLMDAFIDAADPRCWSGSGQAPTEMDQSTRGSRNWDLKIANQLGALTARAMDLRERLSGARGGPMTPDDTAEGDISRFEKAARDAMKKAGIVSSGDKA